MVHKAKERVKLTPSCLRDAVDQVRAEHCCEVSRSHFICSVVGHSAQMDQKKLKAPR